uniref:Uncharacterized protein n=1 Tax=Globodera rostochiensis TaxID=31243 RepID=A0A914HW67_GLORO
MNVHAIKMPKKLAMRREFATCGDLRANSLGHSVKCHRKALSTCPSFNQSHPFIACRNCHPPDAVAVLPFSFFAQFPSSPRAEHCDQFSDDPICQPISARQQHQSSPKLAQNCQHEDLWLIPGKADSSCTRPNPKRLAEVNARQIKILPPIVKLPGCFTIEIQNVRILEGGKVGGNIFAKTEYQWLNAVDSKSGDSKCQNASLNGCGGFGNNCYYCDICKTLRSIDETPDKSNLPPDIAKQFKGMNCPDKIGLYSFRKEFCFNDWSILDANRDCRLDFLESISPSAESDQIGNVQSAMAALQQVGYGTLVAKVRLAYNATPEIEAKRAQKEAQIERTVKKELERKRTECAREIGTKANICPGCCTVNVETNENEIACIRLTFDICQRQPQRKWDGVDGGYTCT